MRKAMRVGFCAALLVPFLVTLAHATLISVSGPLSSAATAPAIIGAPLHALDDIVFNTGMEGFDEALGVLTTVPHATDTVVIPAGTLVDSHMIFLNSQRTTLLTHGGVVWTFGGSILGVMSDGMGNLEAASTFELGNPATNYTATFPGSGPAPPFAARGLEGNNGIGLSGDGYAIIAPNQIRVSMGVTEPGDWIRVVTAPVPEPATMLLLGSGLAGLGGMTWRRNHRK